MIVSRPHAIARLLDMAIWLWALEKDPLAVHLLAMAAYQCLEDMGKKTGKGPKLKTTIGADAFTQAYDFLRHASSSHTAHVALPPPANSFVIFEAIAAFRAIFGGATIYMETFWAHFMLFGNEVHKPQQDVRSRAGNWLPKGVTIEDVEGLTKEAFLDKLTEMFTVQHRASPKS